MICDRSKLAPGQSKQNCGKNYHILYYTAIYLRITFKK